MTIKEYWSSRFLLFDGGMGTLLQKSGLRPGESPLMMNLRAPEAVKAVHLAYYRAGSNVATTNTFALNALNHSESEIAEIVRAAVACAHKAREEAGGPEGRFIALDIGPTGKLLKPFGDLDFEDAVAAFAPVIRAGAAEGADCVLIETMNDCYETKAAVLAAKENCDLPVLVTNAYSEDGRLLTGAGPETMCAVLEGLGADALGANCSLGPSQLTPVMEKLLERASVPLMCQPNAGMPRVVNGKTVYDISPEEYAETVAGLARKGVRVLGGCCGTEPEYIRLLAEKLKGLEPVPAVRKHLSAVTSGSRCVTFEQAPLLIGERINPTGKKRFKQALREADMDYILSEGLREEEAGAQILDVNVGLPEIDEPAMLSRVVCELQAVTGAPLQLDTSSPAAMEAALRRYNGKALLNSVSGREDVMNAVFPLMKKYGGMAVALTLDENGISATAEGRAAIAEKILSRAAEYGLGKEDFLFDPLTMAVSADENAALVTLDALRLIHDRLGCRTVLGVSNVSFGLPGRDALNSVFFARAMDRGLSAAIMNPLSERMMETWRSFLALSGQDARFENYLARMTDAAPAPAETAAADPAAELRAAVLQGRREKAEKLAAELIPLSDPMTVVRDCIIPALDTAGRGFEAGTLYLPQLLMCAEAAQQAFEPVRAAMRAAPSAGGAPVVLATVRGDIHDIGKNIVKLLLENYGFAVLDLGKDVPPEKILAAAEEAGAPLVGLSALMTTTVPAMAETIALLRERLPACRVCVGGAVLTPEYAARVGADAYCATAMDTVRFAEKVFGKN